MNFGIPELVTSRYMNPEIRYRSKNMPGHSYVFARDKRPRKVGTQTKSYWKCLTCKRKRYLEKHPGPIATLQLLHSDEGLIIITDPDTGHHKNCAPFPDSVIEANELVQRAKIQLKGGVKRPMEVYTEMWEAVAKYSIEEQMNIENKLPSYKRIRTALYRVSHLAASPVTDQCNLFMGHKKVKPSNQITEELLDKELPAIENASSSSDNNTEENPVDSLEVLPTSSNGHVSHSHPGSYLNQATAQICSSNNQASTFNLEPRDKNSKVQAVFSEMEETSGVVTSLSSEVVNSTASANSLSSESLNFQPAQSHEIIYPNQIEVEMASGERTIAIPELKAMLRTQLEYYFSRENLSTDAYLISQMDSDNFVPISTIAKFNQIRRLTEDISLVVEVLRESAVVQVDEAGEKVRPNPRSGVLILREIPETTPLKELEELFSSENCPKFSRCEFAHNNSWYVLFDTDEDTQKAYRYLREEAKTFNGKPIMARIKAKAITSAPFTTSYKNGVNNTQETENYNSPTVNPQQQTPVQYTYTNVPNENYSNQVCPPFYPPTMLQAWAPSTPACVDLGTVLSVNGLSPQAAFRPLNNNTNRHSYSSRDRPVKTYTPQNYNFSRSEQSRYFNRGQSTSYLQRQQLHQQPSFPSIVNTNSCGFEYMPYTSRSRNLPNFGMDMNFFTAPNLYYNKLPSLYPAHASQARHNPVLVPRNQVGLGAINSQDQSYLTVGSSTVLPFSKDSVLNSTSSSISSKQNTESQAKDNWGASQRQQRGKRYWKENGNSNSSKSLSENSNGMINKSLNENDAKPDSPKFDLENSSFPPLPGCLESDVIDVDVYESRLSDIVKGTVKPTTRDTKTQTSESALVCTTKDSSTITIEETVIAPDGAFTPPMSPEMVKENVSSSDPMPADTPRDGNEWETFVESPNENTLCNTSINALNVVPDVPAAFPAGSSPAFHSVSTNSMVNGSIVGSETSGNVSAVTESEPTVNVPSDIIENKQTAVVKLPKAKQLDSLPKSRPCDLPSPKNKTPDASSAKNKFDAFKERQSSNSKHRSSFSNNKNAESSSSKERVNELISCNTKTVEHNVTKNVEVFPLKEKQNQGYSKGRILESNSSKSKSLDTDSSLLSVNGHADSESTVSSEDEKPFRKLTYSEVAMRAKEKVEKIAQELKEKERQEAMVRHHRQQEIVAQNKQAATRGPFREFPRGRIIEPRSGSKEWRERRKPARTISLPAAGQ